MDERYAERSKGKRTSIVQAVADNKGLLGDDEANILDLDISHLRIFLKKRVSKDEGSRGEIGGEGAIHVGRVQRGRTRVMTQTLREEGASAKELNEVLQSEA